MQIALAAIGFVLFIGLILIHEWGHYRAARKAGVEVEEFGLGFPPRAWGRKNKDGMMISLNWLPLGGFVKLKGEHDADRRKGSFGAAPLGSKVKIMLAGVTMNLIVAIIMLAILAVVGMPRLIENQFSVAGDTKIARQEVRLSYIDPESPAETAGLQLRDKITSISSGQTNRQITDEASLKTATREFAGQEVVISGERIKGQPFEVKTVIRTQAEVEASLSTDNPKGYLGVLPVELVVQTSTWSAPVTAVGLTGQLSWLTLKGIASALDGLASTLAGLFTGNKEARQNGQTQATEQTGGIVAISRIIWESGTLGYSFMLVIIAVISLTLAIINALPIPALDGGRLFVTLAFRIARKPLNRSLEEKIHGTGMAVLLILFAVITIVDVRRFY